MKQYLFLHKVQICQTAKDEVEMDPSCLTDRPFM